MHVLVLDDFLLNPMNDAERRDLLEVIEDRYDRSSTVITNGHLEPGESSDGLECVFFQIRVKGI